MPKDACYYKVKRQYKVFPSAYASGAIAKCRKNKGKKKKQNAFKQWLSDLYPHLDDQELDIWISNLDKESARSMLEQFQVKDKDVIASANDL